MPGQVPGDGALPGAGWPVNRNDNFLPRCRGRTRTHPRLLVPCLGRAVKPYRLPLPALAPAVNAAVRPARALRESVLESFRGALRDNVPVRPDEAALPVVLLLFHPLTCDFEFRDPLAEWPLLPAERAVPERPSEVRRGCRAFPEGCAGLRLRA